MPDTIKNNDLLNKVFDDHSLLSADISELKRYLLACAEIRETDVLNPRVKEGLPKRKEFIRELITIRLQEKEGFHRNFSIYAATILAALAFALSVSQEFRSYKRDINSSSLPAAIPVK